MVRQRRLTTTASPQWHVDCGTLTTWLPKMAPDIATRLQYYSYIQPANTPSAPCVFLYHPLTHSLCVLSYHHLTCDLDTIFRSAPCRAYIACVNIQVKSATGVRLHLDWTSEPLYLLTRAQKWDFIFLDKNRITFSKFAWLLITNTVVIN